MKFTASYNPPGRAHAAVTCVSGGQKSSCLLCDLSCVFKKKKRKDNPKKPEENTKQHQHLRGKPIALNLHLLLNVCFLMCFACPLQRKEHHDGFLWQIQHPPPSPRHYYSSLEQKSRKEEKKTVEKSPQKTCSCVFVRVLCLLVRCSFH